MKVKEFFKNVGGAIGSSLIVGAGLFGVIMVGLPYAVDKLEDKIAELDEQLSNRILTDLKNEDIIEIADNTASIDLTFIHNDENNEANLSTYGKFTKEGEEYSFKIDYEAQKEVIDKIMLKKDFFKNYEEAVNLLQLKEISYEKLNELEELFVNPTQEQITLNNFLSGSKNAENEKFDAMETKYFHPLYFRTEIVEDNGKKYGMLVVDGIDIRKLSDKAKSYNELGDSYGFGRGVESYFRRDVISVELDASINYSKEAVKSMILNNINNNKTENLKSYNEVFSTKISADWYTAIGPAIREKTNFRERSWNEFKGWFKKKDSSNKERELE